MPFGSEGVEQGIALAMSGGGFRAALFHCGALWRLNGWVICRASSGPQPCLAGLSPVACWRRNGPSCSSMVLERR